MKKYTLLLILFVASVGAFAQDKADKPMEESQSIDKENIITGKIVKIGDNWLIECTDETGSMERILPSEMPENLKKEGLEVVFSGERGTIPPNVRVMGVPFELEMIREIEQIQAPEKDDK